MGCVWKELQYWPFPSAVMLAVAEGYDTFNIVFMGFGDRQASECSQCLQPIDWQHQCKSPHKKKRKTTYNRPFISSAYIVGAFVSTLLEAKLWQKIIAGVFPDEWFSLFNFNLLDMVGKKSQTCWHYIKNTKNLSFMVNCVIFAPKKYK